MADPLVIRVEMKGTAEVLQQLQALGFQFNKVGTQGGEGIKKAAAQWNIMESAITRTKWAAASFALSIASWRTFNFFRDATRDAIAFEKQLHVIQSISIGENINLSKLEKDIDTIANATAKLPMDVAVAVREAQSLMNTNIETALSVAANAAQLSVAMNTDIGSAVTMLTRSLVAYGDKVKNISEITEAFYDAVQIGGATAQEFAETWSKAITASAVIGQLPPQVSAALFGTIERTWGTQRGATYATQFIKQLYYPTDKKRGTYDALGIDILQSGDSAEKFIATLTKMREAVKQKRVQWDDFFDQRSMNAALSLMGSDWDTFIGTATDRTNDLAEATKAMQATTQYQLDLARSAWKTFTKSIGESILTEAMPAITLMNSYLGQGNSVWAAAGKTAAIGTARVGFGVASLAQYGASFIGDIGVGLIAGYKPGERAPFQGWRDQLIGNQSTFNRDVNSYVQSEAQAAAVEQQRRLEEYTKAAVRLGGGTTGGNPAAPLGSLVGGAGGGGGGGRPSFDWNAALERGMVAVRPSDGMCLANVSSMATFLHKAGVPLAEGFARNNMGSAAALGRLAASKGFTDWRAAPIGSTLVFGGSSSSGHAALKISDTMALQSIGNKWVNTAIGTGNLSKFKGYWPTLNVAAATGKAGGFYQPLTLEDILAGPRASYEAAGGWAGLSGLKYGETSDQRTGWLRTEMERGQGLLALRGAMGIPAHDPESMRLAMAIEELNQKLYRMNVDSTYAGFDTSRKRSLLGVQAQLTDDPREQLAFYRESIQLLDQEISDRTKVVVSLDLQEEKEDNINQLKLARKALSDDEARVTAAIAATQAARVAAANEELRIAKEMVAAQMQLEALADRLNYNPIREWALENIINPNRARELNGELPYPGISGSDFNDPNIMGPSGMTSMSWLPTGPAIMGGAQYQSALTQRATAIMLSDGVGYDEALRLAQDEMVSDPRSKIGTMQYLQAFGMLSQMTGMGGKAGGIGSVLSSYSQGVSMWSMLGGTGGGASMLGLGGGSIWGVAGVLLSGLGGLFKKDKVDYEKWLSKIAANTGKMAEAYDTAYAAGPRSVMPTAMAFAGMRGAF